MPKTNKFIDKRHRKSSASKKAPGAQASAAASTTPSWTPTEGCVCPDGCINGSPIDPKNPGDCIPVLCSNDEKCSVESLFLHPECMEKWEEELWPYCHQGSNTNRLGDAGAWFNKHRQTVLWSQKQGYGKIRKLCKCPCGGYLKRDLNALKEDGQAKPCKKKSKAPSAALPEMNKDGLGAPKGHFVQRPKQKCAEAKPKPEHFWEQRVGSKSTTIVGQTKPGSLIPLPRPHKFQDPQPLPATKVSQAEEMKLTDVGIFFECLKEVLRKHGGSVEKDGEVMDAFMDRVYPPLIYEIYSLSHSPVEWILMFGNPDIFLDGDRIALSFALAENGLSFEDEEGEEWAVVGGGERRRAVSESSTAPHSSQTVDSGGGSHPPEEENSFLSLYERDMSGMRAAADEYAGGHEDLIVLWNPFDILNLDREPEEE